MKKLLSVVLAVVMLVSAMACTVSLQASAETNICLYAGLLKDADGKDVTSGTGDNYSWTYADNVLTITTTADANIDLYQTSAFNVSTDKGLVLNYVSDIPLAMALGVKTKTGTGWPSLGDDFYNSLGYEASALVAAKINNEDVKCVPVGSKSAILNLANYFTWDATNDKTPDGGNSEVSLCNLKLKGAGKVEIYALNIVDQEPSTDAKAGGADGYLASGATTNNAATTAAQGNTAVTTTAAAAAGATTAASSAKTGEESNALLFVAIAGVAVCVIAVTAIASKKAQSK